MREQLYDDNMAPKELTWLVLNPFPYRKSERKKNKNENKQKKPHPKSSIQMERNLITMKYCCQNMFIKYKKMWWSTGQFYKTVFKTSAYIPIPTATVHFSFKNIGTTFIKQTKNC